MKKYNSYAVMLLIFCVLSALLLLDYYASEQAAQKREQEKMRRSKLCAENFSARAKPNAVYSFSSGREQIVAKLREDGRIILIIKDTESNRRIPVIDRVPPGLGDEDRGLLNSTTTLNGVDITMPYSMTWAELNDEYSSALENVMSHEPMHESKTCIWFDIEPR